MKRFFMLCVFLGSVVGLQAMELNIRIGNDGALGKIAKEIEWLEQEVESQLGKCSGFLVLISPYHGGCFMGTYLRLKIRQKQLSSLKKRSNPFIIGEEELDLDEESECSLCFEPYSRKRVKMQLPCDKERKITHDFCRPCLADWHKKSGSDNCPTCERPGLAQMLKRK